MFIKSLISSPRHGEMFTLGEHTVMGLAWSRTGAVSRVELSDDFGETWRLAELGGLNHRHVWRQWAAPWTPAAAGYHTLMARAADDVGNVQPMVAANPRA